MIAIVLQFQKEKELSATDADVMAILEPDVLRNLTLNHVVFVATQITKNPDARTKSVGRWDPLKTRNLKNIKYLPYNFSVEIKVIIRSVIATYVSSIDI